MTAQPVTEGSSMPRNGSQAPAQTSWSEANQRYLATALTALRVQLEVQLQISPSHTPNDAFLNTDPDLILDPSQWNHDTPPALEQLCSVFDLSTFERDILLLATGAEMDSRLSSLYASVDPLKRQLPSLNLALTTRPDAHWSALSPSRPLRYWQLIELLPSDTLIASPFRISERILHFLAGLPALDERLHTLVRPITPPDLLPRSFADLAQQIALAWTSALTSNDADNPVSSSLQNTPSPTPVIELCGSDPEVNRSVAAQVCADLRLQLFSLAPAAFSQPSLTEQGSFLRLWNRESILGNAALFVNLDDIPDALAHPFIAHLLDSLHTFLILSSPQPFPTRDRSRLLFHSSKPSRAEQALLWRSCLSPQTPDETISSLISQFNLAPLAIRSAAQRFASTNTSQPPPAHHLWDACRTEARPRLNGLAQHISACATWDDLVLPEKEQGQLRQIALHVRHRTQVYETWGFAGKSSRGLGISALFAGPSGTGKTTAAEVLAHQLRLDLFRIDLSQLINKYIGETEKNLARVFDAAEEGCAVLLFDEADALFGKRTEVKDSHDRYANVEVSYLLQRMEAYRGLAILTTNRRSALDQAFLRRIRFIVEFPFPEAQQRAELWRRIFPAPTPTQGLNIDRLARLRVSGGSIRNIAMGAAFLAADAESPIRMEHLLAAARSEFTKLETPLSDAEVASWL